MNWAELLAPRYFLSRQPDGSLLQIGRAPWESRFLGFDTESARFVTVHALRSKDDVPEARATSAGERIYLAGRISHPALFNVTDYGERDDALFYVTEFEDGEPLPAYVARLRPLPLPLALDVAVQLVALVRYLANYPRILANVTTDDLLVTTSPGQSLCLRVSGLGLARDEPTGEIALLQTWLPELTTLVWNLVGVSVREDRHLKFSAHGSSALLDPFRSYLESVRPGVPGPAPQVFRDFETRLHRQLYRFLQIIDPNHQWPSHEEFVSLRPLSLLTRKLVDDGVLRQWQDHNYEFGSGVASHHSRFALSARDVRTGADVTFQVLPPASLIGDSSLSALYQRLGNPALKDLEAPLRIFFLRSEPASTIYAEEAVNGFNLLNLLERRVELSDPEAHGILARLIPLFQPLEPVPGLETLLTPWNIYFSFDTGVSGEELIQCLTSRQVPEWPPFQVRLRLGPTGVDFCRPVRSEWEEVLHQMAQAFPLDSPGSHPLDHRFGALAVFLLEYKRYHHRLFGGDSRPQTMVARAWLHQLLATSLLAGPPRDDNRRTHFLEGMTREMALDLPSQLDSATPVPGSNGSPWPTASPGSGETAAHALRNRRVSLLSRLLRRQSIRSRQKQKKSGS